MLGNAAPACSGHRQPLAHDDLLKREGSTTLWPALFIEEESCTKGLISDLASDGNHDCARPCCLFLCFSLACLCAKAPSLVKNPIGHASVGRRDNIFHGEPWRSSMSSIVWGNDVAGPINTSRSAAAQQSATCLQKPAEKAEVTPQALWPLLQARGLERGS